MMSGGSLPLYITAVGGGSTPVPILKSVGQGAKPPSVHPIIIPIPIPVFKIANESVLGEGLRAGKEALEQRQRTEGRLLQLGFTARKGSPESRTQDEYNDGKESKGMNVNNDTSAMSTDEAHRMGLIGFSMERASKIIAKRYYIFRVTTL
jgi:hypothetical protein